MCYIFFFFWSFQDSTLSAVTLFFGIIVHKAVVTFSIGMRLVRSHPDRRFLIIGLIIFVAFTAPIGGIIGIAVQVSHFYGSYFCLLTVKRLLTGIVFATAATTTATFHLNNKALFLEFKNGRITKKYCFDSFDMCCIRNLLIHNIFWGMKSLQNFIFYYSVIVYQTT